jgi:2,3-bisphosphoglycerate-dependent phosphoglycerate mutase
MISFINLKLVKVARFGHLLIIVVFGKMKNMLTTVFLFLALQACSQSQTTFILVRHAEKVADGSKDPALTTEGLLRAEKFAELFSKTNIQEIYSTNYIRTKETVAPLAKLKELEVKPYGWKDPDQLLEKMINEHQGHTIVISGHSNTTPVLANLLLGKEQFSQFDDSDYSNILVITTSKLGEGKLIHLSF